MALIEIGKGRLIHQAIAAEYDDPVRIVLANDILGRAHLFQQGRPGNNTAIHRQRVRSGQVNRHFDHGGIAVRGQPRQQLRARHIVWIVATLPLRHQQTDRL